MAYVFPFIHPFAPLQSSLQQENGLSLPERTCRPLKWCVQAFRAIRRLHMGDEGSLHHKLTDREREVLTWIAAGKVAEDVACILGISKFTVERHLSNIREKYGATNTVQSVMEAMRRGETQP
jgi:LuxR family transcriptional regulator, quorum-sensing system regulator BjaR1